jgi:hypothetical protein
MPPNPPPEEADAVTPAERYAGEAAPEVISEEEKAKLAEEASRAEDA